MPGCGTFPASGGGGFSFCFPLSCMILCWFSPVSGHKFFLKRSSVEVILGSSVDLNLFNSNGLFPGPWAFLGSPTVRCLKTSSIFNKLKEFVRFLRNLTESHCSESITWSANAEWRRLDRMKDESGLEWSLHWCLLSVAPVWLLFRDHVSRCVPAQQIQGRKRPMTVGPWIPQMLKTKLWLMSDVLNQESLN